MREGPFAITNNGTEYLFTSGNFCCNNTLADPSVYAIMVSSRPSNSTGAFSTVYPNTPLVAVNSSGQTNLSDGTIIHYTNNESDSQGNPLFMDPGGNSCFKDASGNWWIIYNAKQPAYPDGSSPTKSGRRLMLDKLNWGAQGWPRLPNEEPTITSHAIPQL